MKKIKTFVETFEIPEHTGTSDFEAWAHENQEYIIDTQLFHRQYGHERHFWELAIELYNGVAFTKHRR